MLSRRFLSMTCSCGGMKRIRWIVDIFLVAHLSHFSSHVWREWRVSKQLFSSARSEPLNGICHSLLFRFVQGGAQHSPACRMPLTRTQHCISCAPHWNTLNEIHFATKCCVHSITRSLDGLPMVCLVLIQKVAVLQRFISSSLTCLQCYANVMQMSQFKIQFCGLVEKILAVRPTHDVPLRDTHILDMAQQTWEWLQWLHNG